MTLYYLILFFILGTILGSFYNVVGDRLTRGESIVSPRSHCPNCGHFLTPIELIPIISHIVQGGKCRKCRKKIPVFHPLFECASGILFALSYYIFGLSLDLIIALTFVSLLLIIFVSDIEAMIIPDEVLIVFEILLLIEIYLIRGYDSFITSLWNGALSMGIMYLLKLGGDFLFKKESMGGGDIKLMFVFGTLLGWPLAIISIFLGSIIGLPIALLSLKSSKNHEIPFGPFLSIGALILFFSRFDIQTILNLLT